MKSLSNFGAEMSEYVIAYFPGDSSGCEWYVKHVKSGLDYGRYKWAQQAAARLMELINGNEGTRDEATNL